MHPEGPIPYLLSFLYSQSLSRCWMNALSFASRFSKLNMYFVKILLCAWDSTKCTCEYKTLIRVRGRMSPCIWVSKAFLHKVPEQNLNPCWVSVASEVPSRVTAAASSARPCCAAPQPALQSSDAPHSLVSFPSLLPSLAVLWLFCGTHGSLHPSQ